MTDSAASRPRFIPQEPRRRAVFVAAVAWMGVLVLTLILTGCPRFTALYAVHLVFVLSLVVAAALFLRAIFFKGRDRLFLGFRKLAGYSLVAVYVAQALPRVDWTNAGAIGSGRTVFLYVLTLVCTAVGGAFFIIMTRKSVLVSFGVITEAEARDPKLLKENRKKRKPGTVVWLLEWVDSLAFAVILVLLIDIFVFQIYAVPSESMVPVFLDGDRPFTAKLIAGPRLPLTEWRLPFIKQPARGDVVTIANPVYPENHEVSLKKYLAQVVYMITFTAVNIDRDASGLPKADPLVKRVTGVPGEKLMMVDDVLYHKTASQPGFTVVEADRRYAQVDLWKLPPSVLGRVQDRILDERSRGVLAKWDTRKNAVDHAALSAALAADWGVLSRAMDSIPAGVLSLWPQSSAADLAAAPGGERNPYALAGVLADDLSIFLAAARSASARAALREYLTAPASAAPGPTLYEKGSRALDLLIKQNLLRRIQRDAELASAGFNAVNADAGRQALLQDQRELAYYLGFYDVRNFPEFPAGDRYLGPNEYFAMGDNRYNSQDFRYTGVGAQRSLDPSDPASIEYLSQLGPHPLEKRFIEAYALFRVWPFSRFGIIR